MTTKVELKKIGVLSLGKLQAIIMAIIGLIIGIFYAISALLLGNMFNIQSGYFSIAGIILFPLIYGILGFIGGVIGALVFNAGIKIVGGLEMHFQE